MYKKACPILEEDIRDLERAQKNKKSKYKYNIDDKYYPEFWEFYLKYQNSVLGSFLVVMKY